MRVVEAIARLGGEPTTRRVVNDRLQVAGFKPVALRLGQRLGDGLACGQVPVKVVDEPLGLTVVDHADILIAVLDELGDHVHGPGGTREIAGRAIGSQVPVIVIPPADPAAATVRLPDTN